MKIRMITRTITSSLVSAFVYDMNDREKGPHYVDFELSGNLSETSNKDLLSQVREEKETDTFKVMTAEFKGTKKQKYAMTETDFILHGHIATKEDTDNDSDSDSETKAEG